MLIWLAAGRPSFKNASTFQVPSQLSTRRPREINPLDSQTNPAPSALRPRSASRAPPSFLAPRPSRCSSLVRHKAGAVGLIIPDQRRELEGVQLRMCSQSPGIRTCRAFMNANESPLVMCNSMKGKWRLSFGRRWRKNQNSRGVQHLFFSLLYNWGQCYGCNLSP